MDLQGKPLYNTMDCPLCTAREKFRAKAKGKPACDRCGICPPPAYENNPQGLFEEPSFSHWHQTMVGGVACGIIVKDNLCWDCYAEDHERVYPDLPVPTPPACLDTRTGEA